jgi:hypothetical protein
MPSRLAIIPDCAFTRKLDDVFSEVARERLPSFLHVLNENGRLTLLILDNVDSDEARPDAVRARRSGRGPHAPAVGS